MTIRELQDPAAPDKMYNSHGGAEIAKAKADVENAQAVLDDGHMPVHKVTIIPRGRSLGSTMFIPKKDVLTQAMKRMLNQIAMGLGGRVAEELVLNDISSGAAGSKKTLSSRAKRGICFLFSYGAGSETKRCHPEQSEGCCFWFLFFAPNTASSPRALRS